MRNETGTLTSKQEKFVSEWLVDHDGKRAALAAGYGPAGAAVTAHRLIHTNRAVQAEIAARQRSDATRLQIARDDVIAGLLEGIAIARERRDGATVIRGFAEIGRMLGFYSPERRQVEVTSGEGVVLTAKIRGMSDAELLAVIAGEAALSTSR